MEEDKLRLFINYKSLVLSFPLNIKKFHFPIFVVEALCDFPREVLFSGEIFSFQLELKDLPDLYKVKARWTSSQEEVWTFTIEESWPRLPYGDEQGNS